MLAFKEEYMLGLFNRSVLLDMLKPVKLSLPHLYIILHLHKTPLKCFILANCRYYSNYKNTWDNLKRLESLGYLYYNAGVWGLAGRGEMLYYSFIAYATNAGYWVDDPETMK